MDCTIGIASSTARNEPLILIEDELKPAPPGRSVLSSILAREVRRISISLSSDMPDRCVVVSGMMIGSGLTKNDGGARTPNAAGGAGGPGGPGGPPGPPGGPPGGPVRSSPTSPPMGLSTRASGMACE
eukprot:jgi/Chrpa1/9365/Chrysochromulina_OHIO_Genome00020212-RA